MPQEYAAIYKMFSCKSNSAYHKYDRKRAFSKRMVLQTDHRRCMQKLSEMGKQNGGDGLHTAQNLHDQKGHEKGVI